MDDESSSLKLKLYLFSSVDAKQRQEQQQLPVKEKKAGSSTGRPTYASGLMIGRNPYNGKINHAEFSECLGKANQFLKLQYEKEAEKHPVQIKVYGTEQVRAT